METVDLDLISADERLREFEVRPAFDGHYWSCNDSPIGICVYHTPSDPGFYDRCVFCEQPLERK